MALVCRYHRAFTVIELIASVALCGILLAGASATIGAFCRSYAVNQPYTLAVQNAGVALLEIKAAVRTCSLFTTSESSNTGTANTTYAISNSLLITPPTGVAQAYRIQNNQLRLYKDATAAHTTASDIKTNSTLVLDSLNSAGPNGFTARTDNNGDYLSVQIALTVNTGPSTYQINDSAVARRAYTPN